MAVPTLLLTLATLLCASAAPAREVLFAASPSESIDARTSYSSGAGLVSPWSGGDPQANAVTAYLSKDPKPWTFPLPTESVNSDACQQYLGSDLNAYINCINGDDGGKVTKIKMPSEEIDLSTDLADDTFYLHVRAYATDPAHSRKIGTIEVRLEFNHAVCRPCPEAGPCVGLTGEGVVASVMDPSLAAREVLAEQYTNTVSVTPFTKLMHVRYESGNVQTGFDMGYIKMQAVGPGQCVMKAELWAFFECCGTTWMPAPDGNPIIGWGGRTEEPKIPVAANKLVNCPPGGCLPSSSSAAPAPRFQVLGVIGGREILKKSKKCKNWWKKKVKNARKLKKNCTAK